MWRPNPESLMNVSMILALSLPLVITLLQRKNKQRPAFIIGSIGYIAVAAAWIYAGIHPLSVALLLLVAFLVFGGYGWIRRQLKER